MSSRITLGELSLRALNRPRSPENWKNCFDDPIPLCLRFRSEENPICQICIKYFSPQPEVATVPAQGLRSVTV